MNEPEKLRTFPGLGKMLAAWNVLVDFVIRKQVIPGNYLQFEQTERGLKLDVAPVLKAVADQYVQDRNTGGDGTTRITPGNFSGGGSGGGFPTPGGGGSGTGLPDVEGGKDNPTIDGQPLGWQNLHVCVDDGEGGWTPMTMKVYASNPYT